MARGLTVFSLVCFLALCSAPDARAAESPLDFRDAAELESIAANNLPGRDWDADKVREIARNISSLPDPVAAEVLWAMVFAPPEVNTINFFSNALSAPSPELRKVAVSILTGDTSPDSRRLVLNMLSTEKDSEVIQTVVQGMTHLPRKQAVFGLIDIMLTPGAPNEAIRLTGAELRRLTRADVANDPGAWRDWWLDNEDSFR